MIPLDVGSTIADGSLLIAIPIAIAAGLVSFLSPCVLPLVPAYLSYVTGLVGIDLEDHKRGRMLAGTALFVLGFTAVFVSYGALFGGLGATAAYYRSITSKLSATAAVGVDGVTRESLVDIWSAQALVGVRYSF